MPVTLSKIQQEIVEHKEGAILVLAGPGTGKTRVITERIKRLLKDSNKNFRILALTFTNKAANEMKTRLADFPEILKRTFIGTLHSFCMEVLLNRGFSEENSVFPSIFEHNSDRRQVLIQYASEDPEIDLLIKQGGPNQVDKWLEQIHIFKNELVISELIPDNILRKVFDLYNAGLHASNAIDFDDILLYSYQIFISRPKIANFYQRQYQYILIDEGQDLNNLQYQVIKALCGDTFKNIMMVGDPCQAIFVWNCANPRFMESFEKDFNAKKFHMNENYRSSESIVRCAEKLFPDTISQITYPIKGEVSLFIVQDQNEEAKLILDKIQHLIKNGHKDIEDPLKPNDFAVIGRNRYVLEEIEQELKNRNWVYNRYTSSSFDLESEIMRQFECCLKIIINPQDRFHKELLLHQWFTSVDYKVVDSPDFFKRLEPITENRDHKLILEVLKKLIINEKIYFLEAIREFRQYSDSIIDEDERGLILRDIILLESEWENFLRVNVGGVQNLSKFMGQIALGSTRNVYPEGISLISIHSSKGLEFNVVFLIGMAEGTFPDFRAKSKDDLEEEKRNFFVGITRAKRLLYLTYSKTRKTPWKNIKNQKPSSFLKLINIL